MRSGGIKYFLLALIFGLLAAFGSFVFLNSQKSQPGELELIKVPVAIKTIEAYTELEPSMFEVKDFPKEAVPDDAVLKLDEIVGKYAAASIFTKEPIRVSRLRDHIDDILPSVITKGYRAISIQSDQFQAVADLIVPGDYVDLLVFLPEKTRKEIVVREDQAQLFLENIRVLSISRVTLQGQTGHEEIPDRYAITFEVPMEATKKVVLAENIGVIEVVLRGKDDNGESNAPPIYWEDLQ